MHDCAPLLIARELLLAQRACIQDDGVHRSFGDGRQFSNLCPQPFQVAGRRGLCRIFKQFLHPGEDAFHLHQGVQRFPRRPGHLEARLVPEHTAQESVDFLGAHSATQARLSRVV